MLGCTTKQKVGNHCFTSLYYVTTSINVLHGIVRPSNASLITRSCTNSDVTPCMFFSIFDYLILCSNMESDINESTSFNVFIYCVAVDFTVWKEDFIKQSLCQFMLIYFRINFVILAWFDERCVCYDIYWHSAWNFIYIRLYCNFNLY